MSYIKSSVAASMPKFWMVAGPGPSNVRHPSEEKALEEAARLAALNPGKEFYVLETTSVLKIVNPVIAYSFK